MVADEVVDSEAPEEHAKEVQWQRPWLLWLPVVSAQHRLGCLGLLFSNQIFKKNCVEWMFISTMS
jgi:hypothetical protein